MNSPYAAPNTPIASAKRPRISSKNSSNNLKSPSGKISHPKPVLQTSETNENTSNENKAFPPEVPREELNHISAELEDDEHQSKTTTSSSASDSVAPTPSKYLFSPALRAEHHAPHHRHHHSNGHCHNRSADNSIEHSPVRSSSDSYVDRQVTNQNQSPSPVDLTHLSEDHPEVDEDAENSETAAATVATAEQVEQQEENNDDESDEEDLEEFNPYQFISALPAHSTVCIVDKICLPPISGTCNSSRLPTLALDLDETLVHCTVEPIIKPDLIFPVSFNGTMYQVYVRKRPYLDYFLETVAKSFEVVVFTASQKVYADVLLDKLDPGRKYVHHRLFREACLLVHGNYLKDLHVLGRDLKKSVLVDNSPHAYSYHHDNGIPIESWYDDDGDTELLKLVGFLKRLQGVDDVRPVVREHFKTYQLVENARLGLPTSLSAPPF